MTNRLCGTPHHNYPQTLCTEPTGHYVRDRDPHAGPLIIDGRERGGASWDEPQPPVVLLPSAEPAAACAHCGSSAHTWDDCEAYTRLVAEDGTAEPAAVSAAVTPPTNHGLSLPHADALYDAIATPGPKRESFDDQHARVCAVVRQILDDLLPTPAEPTDRAAVLHEVADELTRKANKLTERVHDLAYFVAKDRLREAEILDREATALRRMADETATETPAVDLPTLAAALDGLHTLIATSSRDWGTYRVDAWLWAVLCGWDCEQTEHDDTCVHGALEETAARHGWDEATIAKARRYRAAVRAVTEQQPAAGARQDGAET